MFCIAVFSTMDVKYISHAAEKSEIVKEYVVQTENGHAYEEISMAYEDETLSVLPEEPSLNEKNILLMELTPEQAYALGQEEGVKVESNITLNGGSLADPAAEDVKSLAERQWNLSAVQAESVGEISGGKKINVAILDSGVDLLNDVEFDYQTSLVPEENTDDPTGHGTIITNIIARNQNGFCETGMIPDSAPIGLYNVRILDENNQTPLSRVIEAGPRGSAAGI